VVVFWLDDPPHSPSTHVIGPPLTWSAICSASATTVCEPGCRPGWCIGSVARDRRM